MGRKNARENTMKLLFQMDIKNEYSNNEIDIFLDNNVLRDEEKDYISKTCEYIINNLEKIDNMIQKYAKGWKISRFAKVDLAILRISVYEILYREDIPIEVSINEALEVSKKYSTVESSKFINGILGSLVRGLDKHNE